jgi:hypothetical protein
MYITLVPSRSAPLFRYFNPFDLSRLVLYRMCPGLSRSLFYMFIIVEGPFRVVELGANEGRDCFSEIASQSNLFRLPPSFHHFIVFH